LDCGCGCGGIVLSTKNYLIPRRANAPLSSPPLAAAAFVITGGACQGPAAIKVLAAALLDPASLAPDGRMRSKLLPRISESWGCCCISSLQITTSNQPHSSNLNQQASYLKISPVHLKLAENYIVPPCLYLSLRSPFGTCDRLR